MVLAMAAATPMISLRALAFEQDSPAQLSGDAILQGTIRGADGKPVNAATVLLEEKGSSTKVETKTNAAGTFVLSAGHAGTYAVRAEKSGWRSVAMDSLVLVLGERKQLDFVLQPSPSTNTSPGAMEFNDEPNFTVAGITDWSNLGLHGSAASSRTSESLARETLTLKSSAPETADAGNLGKKYEVALAYKTKGDLAGARGEVQRALAVSDDAAGHRLLGEIDERLNEPLEAVREYEQAAGMDPSEQNYFDWGTELLLHKAAEPAVQVFTKGSSAHPNSARMLTGLGAALYSNGSSDEAARRLCEASDLQPKDPTPYLFLGEIEKTTPALLPCSGQKLERFAREQPGNALANYYYAMSIWKHEKGSENPASLEQAEALLERAVAIDPKFDEAYLQMGVLQFARGDFEHAIRDYKKAIDINPQLGEAHRQLGLAYQRTGEKVKAQEEFQAYEQAEKTEAAEIERQRRELRQFLIILKAPPAVAPPR
jgi:tetratricopeptide (TPR) repeat protein